MSRRIRTYTELMQLRTLEERFAYLSLDGEVGARTFGSERPLNQRFYRSWEWRRLRDEVISRDLGCDLGVEEQEIHSTIIIHHMNPMTVEEVVHGDPAILDPEFLITTKHLTHNAIHYGDASLLPQAYVERQPGDTDLW